MNHVIGREAMYHGNEHKYLRGYKLLITRVLRGELMIENNKDLEDAGGLMDGDRLEVYPWIPGRGRWSFISSDPLARDLEFLS